MLALLPAIALAGTVIFRVYVHPDAGGVEGVAVDGASGHCVVERATLTCPATGDVRLRWAGGEAWELSGTDALAPGDRGVAWVLASEEARAHERARLAAGPVDAALVRALYVHTGDDLPPVPSRGLLDDLVGLASHPDPLVRQEVVNAIRPWFWTASSGPWPIDAPPALPPALLGQLAADADPAVRRRVAALMRELRPEVSTELGDALLALTRDRVPSVRRAALASLSATPSTSLLRDEVSWRRALQAVSEPGSPGAAAAGTLARLARSLDPSDDVVPHVAVERTLAHHPERAWQVWFAWRSEVPLSRPAVDRLLRDSVGLHRGLILHWADEAPGELAAALRHAKLAPGRTELLRAWLEGAEEPELRAVVGL